MSWKKKRFRCNVIQHIFVTFLADDDNKNNVHRLPSTDAGAGAFIAFSTVWTMLYGDAAYVGSQCSDNDKTAKNGSMEFRRNNRGTEKHCYTQAIIRCGTITKY